MGSVNLLTRFLDCTDSVESESLLEQLVWEQSAPVVEKIVASKIHGPMGEDVRSEVLAAQSAHIDAVSGASYDSLAYADSVQSALDRAGRS